MIRRLPTITYKGVEYFIDERLHEFRSNTRPIEFVPFDSKKGRRIYQALILDPQLMERLREIII